MKSIKAFLERTSQRCRVIYERAKIFWKRVLRFVPSVPRFVALSWIATNDSYAWAVNDLPKNGYFVYKGYSVMWTGWKRSPTWDGEIGQWVGYPSIYLPKQKKWVRDFERSLCPYASYQGREGWCDPGGLFDVTLQQGQLRHPSWSAKTEKMAITDALLRIINVIDNRKES